MRLRGISNRPLVTLRGLALAHVQSSVFLNDPGCAYWQHPGDSLLLVILRLVLLAALAMGLAATVSVASAGQITSDCAHTQHVKGPQALAPCLATIRDSDAGALFVEGRPTTLSCSDIRTLYRGALSAAGRDPGAPNVPACRAIASALEPMQPAPAWAGCLPLSEVGTVLHVAKCLPPYLQAFQLTSAAADDCNVLTNAYDSALAAAGHDNR